MNRSRHLQEMRIVVAEGCTLGQAKRKLAALHHAASLASLAKVSDAAGRGFEGLDAASLLDRTAVGVVSFNSAGMPHYWWTKQE